MESKRNYKFFCNGRQVVICFLFLLVSLANTLSAQEEVNNQQQQSKRIERTAVQEDINEFLGYEDLLLVRYLSLPYDVVMNTNMVSYFVDIGFLLLIFLPFIYLVSNRIPWYYQLSFLLLCFVFLTISVPSAFINKNKTNQESAINLITSEKVDYPFSEAPLINSTNQLRTPFVKLYQRLHFALGSISGNQDRLTYPIVLLLLVLTFFLLNRRVRHHPLSTKVVLNTLLIYGFLWLFLSSGIPWYGLLLFPLVLLFTVKGMLGSDQISIRSKQVRQGVLLTAATIWAIMAFSYRFSNYEPKNEIRAKLPFLASVTQYQMGQKDKSYVSDRIFPQYRTALQYINQEDKSYIYRVGTLMPFFIEKNDRRVLTDNFLDFFQNLNAQFPNPQELALALRAYGFKYIIVDLNLPVNDNTTEGTLNKKFQSLMDFIYQNPQLQLIATDRITRGADGNPMFQVFPEGNPIEHTGWFAVYQII